MGNKKISHIKNGQNNKKMINTLMNKVNSDAAREALHTADELADMIIFHANVRENAKVMSETWEM